MLSYVRLFVTPQTVAHQAPLSMGLSRQEYCSGLPFPSPGDRLNPGTELVSLTSPALQPFTVLLALVVKNSPANAGDVGSIPGLGRPPGEGNGNPLQYSCLKSPTDRGPWWVIVDGVTVRHD